MSLHCKHEDRKLQVYNDQGVETNTASLPWSTHTPACTQEAEPVSLDYIETSSR